MRKAAIALVVLAAVTAVPVAGAKTVVSTVTVILKEFTVKPAPASVAAGKVTFKVKNAGKLDHELVVLRTGTAPGKLKVKSNEAVETGRIGKVTMLKPGKSGLVTISLVKGKYVLLCNLAGHYQAKQYAGFVAK